MVVTHIYTSMYASPVLSKWKPVVPGEREGQRDGGPLETFLIPRSYRGGEVGSGWGTLVSEEMARTPELLCSGQQDSGENSGDMETKGVGVRTGEVGGEGRGAASWPGRVPPSATSPSSPAPGDPFFRRWGEVCT